MIDAKDVHEQMMREDPEYRREYEALEEEFSIAHGTIRARGHGIGKDSAQRLGKALNAPWKRFS